MMGHLNTWWQSLVVVGAPVFPYLGLVLLILLGVLALCVVLYLLYRLAKRLPPAIRYLFWRVGMAIKRLPSLKSARRISHRLVAAFADAPETCSFDNSFDEQDRWFGGGRRPPSPLFVVLGPAGAGKSALLRMAAGRSITDFDEDDSAEQADVVWWKLPGRLALEVRQRLLGAAAQAQRTQLLQALERFCPARPLDGVILTLPVELLLSRANEQRAELAQLARVVTEFCAIAGHRLPVYLVIIGADRLTGFQELMLAGGEHLPDSDLHWFSAPAAPPPGVEAALAAWCQLAQTSILRRLLAALPPAKGVSRNPILLLPAQIAQLRTPLAGWLKDVTAAAGRDQDSGAIFQGVLLTGLTQDNPEPSLWGIDTLVRGLAFARPSSAPPGARHVVRAWRSAGIALALLVGSVAVLAFWMPRTISAIGGEVEVLRTVVRQNADDFQSVVTTTDGAFSAAPDAQRLDRMLQAITVTAEASLGAVLVPTSWFDDTRVRLLSQLGEVTQLLLIAPRVEALMHDTPRLAPGALTPVRAVGAEQVDRLPAYAALRAFLGTRELVGAAMETVQSLPGGVSYQDLVRFVGDDPARFRTPAWEWTAALPSPVVQRFGVEGLQADGGADPNLTPLIDALWERLLKESLDLHPVVMLTEDVGMLMTRLGHGANWTYDDAIALRDALRRLQPEVERPSAQRLVGKMPDATRFITPALTRLSGSSLVSLPQRAEASAEFGRRRDAIRQRLLADEQEGIGRLFALDPVDDTLGLSPELKRFSALYVALMAQPFMQSPPGATPPEQVVSWNLERLDAVNGLSAAMRDYAGAGIQAFDAGLRPNLIRVARQQFRRAADGLFVQAARPIERFATEADAGDSLPALRARAENFSQAVRLYRLTLPQDEGGTASVAGALLSDQALRSLNSLQRQLAAEDPYVSLAADLQRWVVSAAAGRSLGAVMRGDPKERLVLTRDYVKTQYGIPAGMLLDGLHGLTAGVTRDEAVLHWQRLTEALQAFDKGASANGLYEFEQYVLNLAKLSSADDCTRYLAERMPVSWRSDYFSSRLAQMDEAVGDACTRRTAASHRQRYEGFAEWFNRQVAGHPPFSGEPRLASLSRRGFAGVLEQYRGMRGQLPVVPAAWPRPVTHFLAQMDNLSARFAAPEPDKATAAGAARAPVTSTVQARVQFRTNRAQATMSDQIIDWSIHSGSRQHGLRNAGEVFEWRIGEPLEVRLRWAANSPYAPVAAQDGSERYTVNERTAVFRFAGEWSLFDLVHAQGAQGDGFEQSMLRFDVTAVGPQGRVVTQAFLTLTAVDDQMPLALDFPGRAPGFSITSAITAPSLKLDHYLK